MSSSSFIRTTSPTRPQDDRRMAQYWPETKAPRVGLGLGLAFAFDSDSDSDSDSQLMSASASPNAQYPELQYLPRHLLTQEEVLASMSMRPNYSNPLDAPRIQQCEFSKPISHLFAQEEALTMSTRPDYSSPPDAPRIQQCEFSRPISPSLKMRRSFANHAPSGYDSASEEDFPTVHHHAASPHSQPTEYTLPDLVASPATQMRRTTAICTPIAHGAPDSDSDYEEEELQELGPIMAEPIVGIAITDPKYRRIAMWAVEVERQTKEVMHEEVVEEKIRPTTASTKLIQGGWMRWTCLTR